MVPIFRKTKTESNPFVMLPISVDEKTYTVIGCFNHKVSLYDEKGKVSWEFDAEGIPLSIDTGDFNGDGLPELSIVTANSEIILLNIKGEILFRRGKPEASYTSVTLADFNGDRVDEIAIGGLDGTLTLLTGEGRRLGEYKAKGPITHVTSADTDGDGASEILAAGQLQILEALKFTQQGFSQLWFYDPCPKVPELRRYGSLDAYDIDGDGKDEVAVGSRPWCLVTLLDHDGRVLWRRAGLFKSFATHWTVVRAHIGRFLGEEKGYQILVAGFDGIIYVFSTSGIKLAEYRIPKMILTSAVRRIKDRSTILCSFTRDDGFYEVDLKSAGKKLESLGPTSVDRYLDKLNSASMKLCLTFRHPKPKARKVLVWFDMRKLPRYKQTLLELYKFLKRYENQNLTFEFDLQAFQGPVEGFQETLVTQGRGVEVDVYGNAGIRTETQSEESLIEISRFLEDVRIPFHIFVEHYCRPSVQLKTLEKIAEVATRSLKGFSLSEDLGPYSTPTFSTFLERYMVPLLNLCKNYDEKLVMVELGNFWSLIPSDETFFRRILKPEYREVIIPIVKTNNNPLLIQNLSGALGLWLGGVVEDWGISVHTDNWRWNYLEFENTCPPDVLLRLDLLGLSLGATYLRIEKPEEFAMASSDEKSFDMHGSTLCDNDKTGAIEYQTTSLGRRSREIIFNMVGKEAIPSVNREDILGLSPVVFQQVLSKEPIRLRDYWRRGLTTSDPEYMLSYLYGIGHYVEPFPRTQYGFAATVPIHVNPKSISFAKQALVTDGASLLYNEKEIRGEEAKKLILSAFKEHADQIPFRNEEAYIQTVKVKDGYLIYLINPEYFDPREVDAKLKINIPRKMEFRDVLTRENLEARGDVINVKIPAGGFRLLLAKERSY